MSEELPPLQIPSALELSALATAAVPGLTPRAFTEEDSADGSRLVTVVDTGGDYWLLWAPQERMSGKQLDRFVRLNGYVETVAQQGDLPFTVPQIKGIATTPGEGLAFVATSPAGRPVTESQLLGDCLLATSLGNSLAALHELPAAPYAQAAGQRASVQQTREALGGLIRKHRTAIPGRLARRWLDAVEQDYLWNFTPTPVHGSLGAADVYATAEGAVVGVWRFNRGAVGDPAQDLAWLMAYADEPFLERFERAYAGSREETDLHLLTRAQLLSELETLRWYVKGVQAEDPQWKEAGTQALRELDAALGPYRLVEPLQDVVDINFTVEEEPLMRLQGPAQSGEDAPKDTAPKPEETTSGITDAPTEVHHPDWQEPPAQTPPGGTPEAGAEDTGTGDTGASRGDVDSSEEETEVITILSVPERDQ